MAFQKRAALPSGIVGNYHRVSSFRWERDTRELSVYISLYKDAATAEDGPPLVPGFAKFRLYGEKFDALVDPNILKKSTKDVLGLIYAAIRKTSQEYNASAKSTTDPKAHVICDLGRGFYADAEEV